MINKTQRFALITIIYLLTQPTSQADIYVPFGSPNIDGILKENEWPAESHIRLARFYGIDQYSDIWLQWDEKNLYLSGIMQDKSIHEDGNGQNTIPFTQTWEDDSLEVYIHPTKNLSSKIDEISRIIAFTPTGRYQRIDRGRWNQDPSNSITTGLETLSNTIAKINDSPFFNQAINQEAVCPGEQPFFANFNEPVSIKFRNSQQTGEDWRFELAIPWQLLGTKIDTKVVGNNCQLGQGIYPTTLSPQDGLSLAINFYRVGDDDGGNTSPHFTGKMTDASGNQTPNGIMIDEWTIFQGDRYHPKEWMQFILSDQRLQHNGPTFMNAELKSEIISPSDGRRARLKFEAPQRNSLNKNKASSYVIRFTEGQVNITDDLWNKLPEYHQSVKPLAPGEQQTIDVINLQPGQTYTFALRALDEQGIPSHEILQTSLVTPNDSRAPFISLEPTGRGLVLSNGQPFIVAGETALMPWLPLRGLYDGDLCDESPPEFLKTPPSNFLLDIPESCGQGIKNREGKIINGLFRNYFNENIFYTCYFSDGSNKEIALLNKSDSPQDNCKFKETRQLDRNIIDNPKSIEGPKVAEEYFAKLQANNINVLTLFVESLDLNVTPIMFEPNDSQNNSTNEATLRFLDRILNLAKKYNIYILFRLYDDFYYKDNSELGANRKWSDTFWYKQLGKKSPDSFFDPDIYTYHQNRMKPLLERYKDNPNVLGWDLINEIDNKLRFNTATLESRRKWLETMLSFAKGIDRNHLIFYSFLTWDPKDDTFYRTAINNKTDNNELITNEKYIGMDSSLAYRIPNSDVTMPHGYYAHVANPWENTDADFASPLELARGISYGFHHIQDGRPILEGESSPNTFLYQKSYGDNGFTEELDNLHFYRSAWLHFASGGAGANLRWPADLRKTIAKSSINQISDIKRKYLKTFISQLSKIHWKGDLLTVNHVKNTKDQTIQFIRSDSQSALVYLYNTNNEPQKTISLESFKQNTKGSVIAINPENGEILFQQDNLSLNAPINLKKEITHDIAFIITEIVRIESTSILDNNYSLLLPHVVYREMPGNELQVSAKLKLVSNKNGNYVFQLQEYTALAPKNKTSETVTVDKNFEMTIPRLLFESNGKKQFISARLQGVYKNNELYFEVLHYDQI